MGPRPKQPPAPRSRPVVTFAPGQPVRILAGMSKGLRGIVVARWHDIGGAPHWRIDLPDSRDRVLRADYLEKCE